MAYEWMVSGNYYDKTRYAMVQTYFWGCLAGFEQDWDIQEETMKKLEWAIRDGRVLSLFHEMRAWKNMSRIAEVVFLPGMAVRKI